MISFIVIRKRFVIFLHLIGKCHVVVLPLYKMAIGRSDHMNLQYSQLWTRARAIANDFGTETAFRIHKLIVKHPTMLDKIMENALILLEKCPDSGCADDWWSHVYCVSQEKRRMYFVSDKLSRLFRMACRDVFRSMWIVNCPCVWVAPIR